MRKIIPVLMLFVLFSACYSKRQNAGNYYCGNHASCKRDKDIIESKEILLTSLFAATSHVPEEVKTVIEIFEEDKSSLSKEAAAEISHFAAEILSYEDYFITVEGHSDISEIGPGENYKKLSEKRAQTVKRALIKNGIDKDKIEFMGIGSSKPAVKDADEEGRKQNRRVVIEAELW